MEKFNIIIATTTEFDSLGIETGYSVKETNLPIVGLIFLVIIFSFLAVIINRIKS